MAELDTLDVIVLGVIFLGTIAYFTKGKLWGVTKDPYANGFAAGGAAKPGRTRNIVEAMEESGKNCVVFYGSQTGTAEDYASRLAKEGKSRFGLNTMIALLQLALFVCIKFTYSAYSITMTNNYNVKD